MGWLYRFKRAAGGVFGSIFLVITLALSIVILVVTALVGYTAEQKLQEEVRLTSIDSLTQVSYVTNIMQDSAGILVRQLLVDNDLTYVMSSTNADLIKELYCAEKLCTYAAASPFVHSIYAYNAHRDTFYTTLNKRIYRESFFDTEIVALMKDEGNDYRSTVLHRVLPAEDSLSQPINTYTYTFYTYYPVQDRLESAIFINIDKTWITDTIRSMDTLKNSTVLVTNDRGDVLTHVPGMEPPLSAAAQEACIQAALASEEGNGNLVYTADKSRMFLTHVYSSDSNCHFIRIQPYQDVIHPVSQMRRLSYIIAGAILFLGILLSLMISRKIYSPVEKVMVTNRQLEAEHQMLMAREEASFIRECLTLVGGVRELDAAFEKKRLSWDAKAQKQVVLISLDNVARLEQTYSAEWLDGVVQDIALHSRDTLGQDYLVYHCTLPNHALALLLCAGHIDQEALLVQLREIQALVERAYQVTATFSLSATSRQTQRLPLLFKQAEDTMHYRLFYGPASLLPYLTLEYRIGGYGYNAFLEKERQLELYLEAGDATNAKALFADILQETAGYSYEDFNNVIIRLAITAFSVLNHLERSVSGTVGRQVNSFIPEVAQQENLADIQILFDTVFDEAQQYYDQKKQSSRAGKMMSILENATALIAEEYGDPNLSLDQIAHRLDRSSTYLGRVFKNHYGLSIAEYINKTRLEHAKKLLVDTSQTVQEIAETSGFSNINYFYTYFKQELGVTPNRFRVSKRHG